MSNLRRYKNLCDLHTHTIYSLHAMSSPTEMVESAMSRGLKYIGLTDHYYPISVDSYPNNFNNTLWDLNSSARLKDTEALFEPLSDKIHVLAGYEYNLFDIEKVHSIKNLNIIGLHNWFVKDENHTLEAFSEELYAAIKMGKYKMIAHLERGLDIFKTDNPFDKRLNEIFENVIKLCIEYGVVLEVNTASLHSNGRFADYYRIDYMKKWLKIAKEYGCNICINSDAHTKYDVGNISKALSVLEEIDYPVDNIVNFDESKIRYYFVFPRYEPII